MKQKEVEKSSKEYVEDSSNFIGLLKNLLELEGKVLQLLFEEQKPLDEILNILGIPRERIRQLKQKALRRLKINSKLIKSLYSINNLSVKLNKTKRR